MRKRNVPHLKNVAADYVTFSIGIATSDVKPTQTKEDFINKADEMLYHAKKKGRNRYMVKNF